MFLTVPKNFYNANHVKIAYKQLLFEFSKPILFVATIRKRAFITVSDRRDYVLWGDALGGAYYPGHATGGIGINREWQSANFSVYYNQF